MPDYAPEPWSLGGELIRDASGTILARISYAHHGHEHTQDFQTSQATAHLITAAPDLLEALLNIETNLTGTDNLRERLADSLRRARAAIALVQGPTTGEEESWT